jgi:hypothetical protein
VVLDVIQDESVRAGRAGGHPDAAAIEAALSDHRVDHAPREGASVDERVLAAATDVGLLISNDLALGRRARNLGASWLRTADLVIWMAGTQRLSASAAPAAIVALRDAGRISPELAGDYLEDLA